MVPCPQPSAPSPRLVPAPCAQGSDPQVPPPPCREEGKFQVPSVPVPLPPSSHVPFLRSRSSQVSFLSAGRLPALARGGGGVQCQKVRAHVLAALRQARFRLPGACLSADVVELGLQQVGGRPTATRTEAASGTGGAGAGSWAGARAWFRRQWPRARAIGRVRRWAPAGRVTPAAAS